MVRVEINSLSFFVRSDFSVLEACKFVGIHVPRFCYHENLSVAGNCRMCLVEIGNSPKPVASCALPILNNMKIFTDTPLVKKARENVVELLLLNHPLDCPICDQAGECDLQDQTKYFGGNFSRFLYEKRGVEDKVCGSLIKTIMTRCIHCTRCVRFCSEVAGVDFLGTLNRGTSTEIGGYLNKVFISEISGNVIDLCPVGALTSKPYAFRARPWELRMIDTIDLTDSLGSNISINFKESEVLRVIPKSNLEINGSIISDKARFSHDAFQKNRIFKYFKSNDWEHLIKKFEILLSGNKKVIFVIDNSTDFDTLNLLKNLKLKYPSVSIFNEQFVGSNFFINLLGSDSLMDLDKTSNTCFLFASDIKVENAIINSKLRMKYSLNFFKVYGFGLNSSGFSSINFVNLNTDKFIAFLEGKDKIISNLFLQSFFPVFILGQAIVNRGFKAEELSLFLKKIYPSSVVLNVLKDCNEYAMSYFSFDATKNSFLSSDALVFVNTDDNLSTSRLISSYSKFNTFGEIFIFSTHEFSSIIGTKIHTYPIFSEIEEEQEYINLEGRIQKTSKILTGNSVSRSFKSFLRIFISTPGFQFLNELILYPFKFSSFVNNQVFSKKLNFSKSSFLVSLYPFKNMFYDFYCSSKLTKVSSTMSLCSRDLRKNSSNF